MNLGSPKRLIALASVASLLALAACSDDSGSGNGGSGGDGEPQAMDIGWMTILHAPNTPPVGGPAEVALEEHTGHNIDFQWVPAANATESLNAALASDTLTEIVTLDNVNSSTMRSAFMNGQFWQIDDYLADYPNLSQIPEEILEGARVNGGLYGVPIHHPVARYGMIIRQDWLDNLGLDVPHTLEEVAEVARAFTEDDPDGNGEHDTVGILDRAESFNLGFRSIAGYFGAGNHFEVDDDGTIVPSFTTDNFMEAMEWYRDLYEDGAINQEFVTMQKQNQFDAFTRGRGGMIFSGLFEAKNFYDLAVSADPNTEMELTMVNDLTVNDVPRRIVSDTNGGVGGWISISKTNVPTEDELREVLGFLDKLLDEEAHIIFAYGVEGEHYQREDDGAITIIDQDKWTREVQPMSDSRPTRYRYFPTTNELENVGNELMEENVEFAVFNPAQSLTSETYDVKWSELRTDANAAYDNFMMGNLTIEEYAENIAALGPKGLDAISEEFTAAAAEVAAGK